jgi:predicted PurR-regulated permease PerM
MNGGYRPPPILALLVGGASAYLLFLGLRATADLVVPLLLTLMVLAATTPHVQRLQQRGLPPRIAVIVVYIVIAGVAVGGLAVFAYAIGRMANQLPSQQAQLDARLQSAGAGAAGVRGDTLIKFSRQILLSMVSIVGALTFALIAGLLVLLDSPRIIAQIPERIESDPTVARGIEELRSATAGFLAVSTRSGIITAGSVTVLLLVLRVHFAVVLGMLTFVANYIPSIGLVIAAVPAVMITWIQYGTGRALLVAIGFTVIGTIVSQFIKRSDMQRRLNLSAPVLLLSTFFWTYALGTGGAFVAAPLTVLVRIILERSDQTRWLATLMSAPHSSPRSATPGRADGGGSREPVTADRKDGHAP